MSAERSYVTGGIPARLQSIANDAQLADTDIATLVGTTAQAIWRWKQGANPRTEQRDRLLDLYWIASQLAAVYEPQDVHLWLYSRNNRLDGEKPADRIREGRAEEVVAIVNQLRTGAYT